MADYSISKEAVQETLIELRRSLGNERYISIGLSMALSQLEGFPQMDAVPVVHGRWIKGENWSITCSECGCLAIAHDGKNYCPYCGAKMDGGAEG